MANIVLTNLCNLSCPYCFAGELRAEDVQYLSEGQLDQIAAFLRRSHAREVGLIGGEPTLHPRFGEMATRLVEEFSFRKVFVYTNGIHLEKYFPRLLRPEICYLVNVNDPREIGQAKFRHITEMLEKAEQYGMLGQLSLGVNVYRPGQDFEPMLELCRRFGYTGLRLSVVVPDHGERLDRFQYFSDLKPTLMALYRRMKELGIVPKYDCNIVPSCIFTAEELAFLQTMPGSPNDIARITGEYAACHPVIDIYPDFSVARCFGMSHVHDKKLQDFQSLDDIIRYFVYSIDGPRLYGEQCARCRDCYQRQVMRCYGGCIAFLGEGGHGTCTDSGT